MPRNRLPGGGFGRESVTKMADRLIGGLHEQRSVFQPAPTSPLPDRSRLRITPRHFAYLKISEGCDRLCTFCAIPKMRGKHATKPIEEVLSEARELVADGVRELNIVAQDTTYYGLDLYGRTRLAELLTELDKIEGLDWIRVMYLYPMYFTDDLIDVLAKRSASSLTWTCLCSTSTTRCCAACKDASIGKRPRRCSRSCVSRSRTW